MDDDLSIPDFLRISSEERAQAWERTPPRPMPAFAGAKPASNDTSEFAKAEEERKTLKTKARIRKMLAKKAAVDPTTHYWDARSNRWIPNRIYKPERNMRPDFNSMAGPELVKVHNEMMIEASGLGLPGAVVKKFESRAVGLRRCEELFEEICTKKGSNGGQPPVAEPKKVVKETAPSKAKATEPKPKEPKTATAADPLAEAWGIREGKKQYAILKYLYERQGKLIAESEIVKALGVLASRIRVAMKVMNKSKFEMKAEKDDKGETRYGLYSKSE